MGISTSGSLLIIFAAGVLALGTLYSSGANTVEALQAAEASQVEHDLAIHGTALAVTNASYNSTAGVFTVKATNTGERAIDVATLSTVADATFLPQTEFETATVAGRGSTVWRPGQELVLQDTDDGVSGRLGGSVPDHVKLVTGHGVAALSEVRQFG